MFSCSFFCKLTRSLECQIKPAKPLSNERAASEMPENAGKQKNNRRSKLQRANSKKNKLQVAIKFEALRKQKKLRANAAVESWR
jgi:hypothetical protein